ncbi:MAG TPA: IPT/TIG domain-containing protein [Chloroflexia bacterium]|nr:IPT/TIG domain-containing protein [Chloroflexia bacterium]
MFLIGGWVVMGSTGAAGAAQTETRSGTFNISWGDGKPGTNRGSQRLYFLTESNGRTSRLLLDEKLTRAFGGPEALNRKQVKVSGVTPVTIQATGGEPTFQVQSIQPAVNTAVVTRDTVTGSKPYITILCKFSDVITEPKPLSYFGGLLGTIKPGLDDYWREVSYNNVNLLGSTVTGWYVLPQPRSYYIVNGLLNFDRATSDCTGVADSVVNFPSFYGINLMFNDELDGSAWGGSRTLTLDGQTKTYSLTWEPPWGYSNQGAIAHEMAHSFGMEHSANAFDDPYKNQWDVVSDIWDHCPPAGPYLDPNYGCVGQHTIAYSKDQVGWIPAAQRFNYTPGSGPQTLTLEQLSQPQTNNYLIARIPIGTSGTQFYTVEARRTVGYDSVLPGSAVIIHQVDTTRDNPAQVVDADGNGNTGDAGAMWEPGEIYNDTTNGISISVDAATATGFVVTINPNPQPVINALAPNPVIVNSGNFTLNVYGSGFVPNSVVRWNGTDRPTTFISSAQLSAAISATDINATGTASLTVYSPGPGGGISNVQTISINNPAPAISSISPASVAAGAPGFTLTINGSNFLNSQAATSTVTVNGANKQTLNISNTQITIAISASDIATPGPIPVSVTNPGPGGGTSTAYLNVLKPSITGLVPSSVPAGSSGTTLIVKGSGFYNGSKVRFNGSDRTASFDNATGNLSVALSAADLQSSGAKAVVVVNSTSVLSDPATFTVQPPAITGLSPAAVLSGTSTGFTLTVYGTNFISGSQIKWGTTTLTTNFVSDHQLTATISPGNIGAATSANQYTIPVQVLNGSANSNTQGFAVYSPICSAGYPLVVFNTNDSSGCGGLTWALSAAAGRSGSQTITLIPANNTLTLNATPALPDVPLNVTLYGGCGLNGPLVTINAGAVTTLVSGKGLFNLSGGDTLSGLKITGLKVTGVKNILPSSSSQPNRLTCVQLYH